MPDPRLTVDQFAAKVKAQYPDYANVDNAELVDRIVAKYPEYQPQIDFGAAGDNPQGDYNFGSLGSVQGMRTNGRPATRQEAFQQLTGSAGAKLAQTMGPTAAANINANRQTVQSMTDPDQQTTDFMGDLAGTLLAGGDPAAGQAARWAQGETAGSAARLAAKFALNRVPGVGLVRDVSEAMSALAPDSVEAQHFAKVLPFLKGLTKAPAAPVLEEQTSPTYFEQFGEQQHLPVNPSQKSYQVFPPDQPTPAMNAADARESGTAARPAVTATRTPAAPTPGSTPPASSPDPAGPPVTGLAGTNEGAPADAPPVTMPDLEGQTDPKQFYAKTPARSNLPANKRQLASPTGSAAPNPGQSQGIKPVTGFSLADFKNFANVLDALTKK